MLAAVLAAVATMLTAAPAIAHDSRLDLRFRGQASSPTGTIFEGTTVGGLSSITYDSRRGVYYAISDDASQFQPVRFYTVALDVRDGRLTDGDVRFKDVTTMLAPDGQPYAPFSLDPEGLALTKDRELILTSEGIANSVIDPFVRRYSLDGSFLGDLPVPQAFLVTADQSSGVRQNLGFESAGVQRPRPLRRGRERALPGRPAGDRVERQPGADPALRPAQRPGRPPVDLHHRPRRAAARAADRVLRQRARGAAAARRRLADRDGALVLRRRTRDGQHDQALRGLPAAGRRPARSCCSTSTRSASRSTTSRG